MKRLLVLIGACLLSLSGAPACELCAIYSASSARGEGSKGFSFTVTEQFVSQNTTQRKGEELDSFPPITDAYLNTWWTHLVPGYSFTPRIGLNLSIPYIYRKFYRAEIASDGSGIIQEKGHEHGLGDIALIGRFSPIQKTEANYSVLLTLMAGVKFPTGDPERLDDEVARAEADRAIFGPNHPHNSIGGIHQHDLTLGSGSYDGIFGSALTVRWKRLYFGNQLQYYLRTEARGYEYADMFIASGGPGGYLVLHDSWTMSLQANVYYETAGSDRLIGQRNSHTGMTAWYAGPQLNFTIGEQLSFNLACEVPITDVANRGIMTVVDYRIHGGLTWSF